MQLARCDSLPIRSALYRWSGFDDSLSQVCPMCQHGCEDMQHFISECPAYEVFRFYARCALISALIEFFRKCCDDMSACYTNWADSFVGQWQALSAAEQKDVVLGVKPVAAANVVDDANNIHKLKHAQQLIVAQIFASTMMKMLVAMFRYRSAYHGVHDIRYGASSHGTHKVHQDERVETVRPMSQDSVCAVQADYIRRVSSNSRWLPCGIDTTIALDESMQMTAPENLLQSCAIQAAHHESAALQNYSVAVVTACF